MTDIFHQYGSDLVVSATGDLLAVDAPTMGQQRILRRLLTNPGDYIFHTNYGAGLPQKVGQTMELPKIKALISGQMKLEESVVQTPAPVITLTPGQSQLVCNIKYTDQKTQQGGWLSFNVNR